MSETANAHESVLAAGQSASGSLPRLLWGIAALCCVLVLGGCGTFSGRSAERPGGSGKGGGYYLDDGPGDSPPANLDRIPDAVPRLEPLVGGTLRPYTVMGRTYVPMTRLAPYRERGMATWYGRRYHGRRTASGEIYDMYAMTGAHPVLPIPSYARVTHLGNGRSVIVRINDRGPFLDQRLIDLSYAAAHRLDIVRYGSARVEVEAVLPGEEWAPPATVTVQASPDPRAASPAHAEAQSSAGIVASAQAEGQTSADRQPAQAKTQSSAGIVPRHGATAVETVPLAQVEPPTQVAPLHPPEPQPASSIQAVQQNQPNAFYLQLGAFSVPDNAQRFVERVRVALSTLAANLLIVNSDSLHRVHAGPYASRDEALEAANRIGASLGSAPVLVAPR